MSGLRLRNSYIVTGIGWSALLLFALLASVVMVSTLESRYAALGQAAPFHLQSYAAANESWTGNDPRIRRTLINEHGSISAIYSFVSFNNDPIEVEISVQNDAYDAYRQTFGYRQQELDALFDQQIEQLEQAQTWAIKNRASQQQLNKISTNINNTYNRAVKNLIRSRGFRFLNENLLSADIPEIVSNNVALFRPVALSLQKTMRKLSYSETDTISTALPLVQTAVAYEALPNEQNGRITAGFSPPLEVFMEGRGDCDAKSALLASILLNWDKVKLIGVGVPGHYLLGILQHPAKGDAFIEYDGLTYVLMEPSGPAWVPPGIISDYTLKWLDSQDQVILEQIALN